MRSNLLPALGASLVAAVTLASPACALTMEVIGDQIILTRDVAPGDLERFRTTIAASPVPVTTVVLRNTQGGHALTGQRLAHEIRARGLRTALSGTCHSACARIFLGGTDISPTVLRPRQPTSPSTAPTLTHISRWRTLICSANGTWR